MKKYQGRVLSIAMSVGLTLGLVACGGGGDSGSNMRTPLATLSQDVLPTGARVDLRSSNYFPAAAGDTWRYDYILAGVNNGPATRRVTSASGNDFTIEEAVGSEQESLSYRRTADGILAINPLGGVASAAAQALIGDLLEYAEPFYAVGGNRQSIRQGSWGADLDGDGTNESFRLEISQVFVGLENLTLPDGSAPPSAHFRNVTALTLQPSDPDQPVVTVTATENAWWAPNIGPVRAERTAVDSSGATVLPLYTLVITGGTVGGNALFLP